MWSTGVGGSRYGLQSGAGNGVSAALIAHQVSPTTGAGSYAERASPKSDGPGPRDQGDAERVRGTREQHGVGVMSCHDSIRQADSRGPLEQSLAIQTMAKLLQDVSKGTRDNERSTKCVDEAAHALLDEAEALRRGVERFKI